MHTHLKEHEDGQASSSGTDERSAAQAGTHHQPMCRKRKLEDEHLPARVAPTQLLSNDGICAKCARLDLGGALQTATRIRRRNNDTNGTALSEGIRIASVGSQYRKPPLPGCVLCPILFASRISPEQGLIDNDHGDEIRLFGLLDHLYMIQPTSTLRKFDSALLATVPRQFGTGHDMKRLKVHVQNEGAAVLSQGGLETARFAAKAVPNSFDVKIVNHWLRDCQGTHTSLLCGVSTNSTVSAIRLIDCTTLSISDAESNTPYVALSYVWGNPGDINTQLQHAGNRLLLPERVSATISDAISATKALGFQYLWVDKFCIDQDDAAVKHEQIKQMNVIYENAELTIVAAAGVDETYGLPGVGQRPRTPQGAATFNGLSVISTMKDPHISIRSSRWASRGWTFQEALLSRRRLFFTDQQLYFECDAMNCFESIHNPWRRNDVLRVGLFGRGTDKTYGENVPGKSTLLGRFHQYLSAVKDYSSRELTYDSDSLNAFEGITQRYSKLEHPLTAIWGIPYPAKGGDRILYFCWALTWIHTKSCWIGSRRPRRRQQFPSWTWAGWAGAVETWQESASRWERKNSYLHGIRSVRFGNGDDDDEGLNSLKCETKESRCRVLRLLAKALPPSLFSSTGMLTKDGDINWWTVAGHQAYLFPSNEEILEEQFMQDFMDVGQWRCIWVCSFFADSFVMALKRNHDTGMWARAGMFCIKCFDYNMTGFGHTIFVQLSGQLLVFFYYYI